MEMMRPYLQRHMSGLAGYLALQRALMSRFVARGGTAEEFCARLAPVYRRRYAAVLAEADGLDRAA